MSIQRSFRVDLTIPDVKGVCISHNYYTAGNIVEYENMFSLIPEYGGITPDILNEMARDIKSHSNTDDTVEDIEDYLIFRARVFLDV